MRPRDLVLNAALAAIAWTPSVSQSNSRSTPRFGIIAGANLATISGGYFQKVSHRTGFTGGVMAMLPVATSFAIQPELMFTMKGANSDSGGFSATAKMYYIELPLLARFEIPASGRVKPFVYGGPALAYRTSCTLEGRAPGLDIKVSCDQQARQGESASPGVKYRRTDVDGIIGGGLAFDIAGRTTSVGVRYDMGFVNFFNRNSSKNRVLSFMGTLEWRVQK